MNMDIEEIRKKRLQQLQDEQLKQQGQMQQQIAMLEEMAKQAMTPEAFSRYMTLKVAHPEKAVQAIAVLAQKMQQGLSRKVTDEEFKDLLIMLEPKKREFTITRK